MNAFGEALTTIMQERGIGTLDELVALMGQQPEDCSEATVEIVLACMEAPSARDKPRVSSAFWQCLGGALGLTAEETVEGLLFPFIADEP